MQLKQEQPGSIIQKPQSHMMILARGSSFVLKRRWRQIM